MDKQTEYVEKLSAQIVEWDAQIDQLKYKADSGTLDAGSKYSADITALQQKRDEAALKLQKIAPTSSDEWQDVKTGTDNIVGEIRTALSDAITKIK